MQRQLSSRATCLGTAGSSSSCAQFRRRAAGDSAMPGSAQTPTRELGLRLGRFGNIEQRHRCGLGRLRPLRRLRRGCIERKGKAICAARPHRTPSLCSSLGLSISSNFTPSAAGASSLSIDVNSSSVNSSRHASRSGACVSIAARSSSSGTWQSMVTSSFESSTASRFCSSDSR